MGARYQCIKVGYRRESSARAALKILRARGMTHYYRCKCGLFHLSSG